MIEGGLAGGKACDGGEMSIALEDDYDTKTLDHLLRYHVKSKEYILLYEERGII